MKKYFIAETEEEVQFGDTIQVDLTKKTKKGVHKVEGEIRFTPDTLSLFLELGIIEEKEVEDEEMLDFQDSPCEALDDIWESIDAIEDRLVTLEKGLSARVDKLTEQLTTLLEVLKPEPKKKK